MSDEKRKLMVRAWAALAPGGGIGLAVAMPGWIGELRATHGAVAAYVDLISSANLGDLDGVRRVCSSRYRGTHTIKAAKEGGVVGFPRNMHKNFQAWRRGDDVLLCPTNRVGPVYRFVREGDAWKFDGPAGILGPGGQLIGGDDREDEGDHSP